MNACGFFLSGGGEHDADCFVVQPRCPRLGATILFREGDLLLRRTVRLCLFRPEVPVGRSARVTAGGNLAARREPRPPEGVGDRDGYGLPSAALPITGFQSQSSNHRDLSA